MRGEAEAVEVAETANVLSGTFRDVSKWLYGVSICRPELTQPEHCVLGSDPSWNKYDMLYSLWIIL